MHSTVSSSRHTGGRGANDDLIVHRCASLPLGTGFVSMIALLTSVNGGGGGGSSGVHNSAVV